MRSLARLPVLAGMALLLAPWAFVAVNAAAGWTKPGQVAIAEIPLNGVKIPIAEPVLTASGLWSGAFQKTFTPYFDQNLPLFASAVELKNQIYFSVLQQSGTPGVTIGKHGQLFEDFYVAEYCGRNSALMLEKAEDWAAELAQIQQWYAARGKVFVYVITPSKAASYPQYLPNARLCRSPAADRDSFVPGWDATLARHGVRFVDAASLLRQAKPNYPFELFPRGGTHWNEIGAALATQALVRAVGSARLPDFTITWKMAAPVNTDRDLIELLNLPRPRLDYQTPQVAVAAVTPAAVCDPPAIAFVGGSFMYEMAWTFMKLACAPKIDFYVYFKVIYAGYPGDNRHDIDPQQRADALLRTAEVVVLEENEQVATRSQHGPAFYAMLAAQFGGVVSQ